MRQVRTASFQPEREDEQTITLQKDEIQKLFTIFSTDASAEHVKISISKERSNTAKKRHSTSFTSRRGHGQISSSHSRTAGLDDKSYNTIKLLLRNVYRLLSFKRHWQATLNVSLDVKNDLVWWLEALDHWNGKVLEALAPEWVTLETDESLEGWRSRLADGDGRQKYAQGFWN